MFWYIVHLEAKKEAIVVYGLPAQWFPNFLTTSPSEFLFTKFSLVLSPYIFVCKINTIHIFYHTVFLYCIIVTNVEKGLVGGSVVKDATVHPSVCQFNIHDVCSTGRVRRDEITGKHKWE